MLSLDELANGKLPKHLIDSIGELEITVSELAEWKSSQHPIFVAFKNGRLIVDVRLLILTALPSLIALYLWPRRGRKPGTDTLLSTTIHYDTPTPRDT